MRNAGKMAVLCVAVFSLLSASGCKKKFDPNDFDAGAGAAVASASVDASTTAPAIDSSAATTADADAGDGLAPLQEGKQHAAVGAGGGGGGGGATKPKADPPECVEARNFCNARIRNKTQEKNCNDSRFACFNKGGHL